MKKKLIKENITKSLDYIEKLLTEGKTSVFNAPIVPSDCPTYDTKTSAYIRDERLRLYVRSWIIPKLKEALDELSR